MRIRRPAGTPSSHAMKYLPMSFSPPRKKKGGIAAPRMSQRAIEILDLPFRLVPGDSVAFLDFSCQVFAIAVGNLEVVVGQPAPLGLELAGELLPLAFD